MYVREKERESGERERYKKREERGGRESRGSREIDNNNHIIKSDFSFNL